MMSYEFGVGEYETRNGKKADVLAERNGKLIGIIYHPAYADGFFHARWNKHGAANSDGNDDLVLPKQRRTYWININNGHVDDFLYETAARAKEARTNRLGTCPNTLACKQITVEFVEGEGLDP